MELRSLFALTRREKHYERATQEHHNPQHDNPHLPLNQVLSPDEQARALARCSTVRARALLSKRAALNNRILPLGVTALTNQCEDDSFNSDPSSAPSLLRTFAFSSKVSEAQVSALLKFLTQDQFLLTEIDESVLHRAIIFAYAPTDAMLEEYREELPPPAAPSFTESSYSTSEPAVGGAVITDRTKDKLGNLINDLIAYAVAQGCSDIHITPWCDGTRITLRRQGEILSHDEAFLPRDRHEQLSNRFRILATIPHLPRDLPRDGVFNVFDSGSLTQVRISIMPTLFGDRIALRLAPATTLRDLRDLGLPETALAVLVSVTKLSSGLVLIAGLTGSGKTTTAYAMLRELVAQGKVVLAAEDPVECTIPGVAQTSLNADAGRSFGSYLRSVLRQDPDVIFCGEIRDEETAQGAIRAALGGHLVISTIHAPSITSVVDRCNEFKISRTLLLNHLALVFYQRLVVLPDTYLDKNMSLEQGNQDERSNYSHSASRRVLDVKYWLPNLDES